MGKATRWLKGVLEVLKGSGRRAEEPRRSKEKRRWSFVKSSSLSCNNPNSAGSANQHAIAVAAASAAAAEAAVAAAQAAAAVVSLTTVRRRRPDRAAVLIQSHFRGYLARRALKALKGLVKLQALVRGHIMRKKTAETMRCIQAMLRAQARARSVRSYDSPTSSGKSSQINHPDPATPEKSELTSHYRRSNESRTGNHHHRRVPVDHPFKGYVSNAWSGPQLGESRERHTPQYQREREGGYYMRPDKILEIDTGGRQYGSRGLDFYSGQLTSKGDDDDDDDEDDSAFCSRSRRRQVGLHTPTKSDASATSCFSDCPSYMAFTESSKAKMRSMSAPRHRPLLLQQHHHYDSMKRWSVHHQTTAPGPTYAAAAMHASFASKAYPGSGHLDTLGMPIRNNQTSLVYYSGYLN